MQSVRCDACGMKALVAASQCPHCGHLFDLRDSFGELLPLAQCPTCESYYPLVRGECRWCGTKPERRRLAAYKWKLTAGLGFVALAVGATLAHLTTPATADQPTVRDTTPAVTVPPDSTRIALPTDSVVAPNRASTPAAEESSIYLPTPTQSQAIPVDDVAAPDVEAVRPREPKPNTRAAASKPAARSRPRWVSAVAHRWLPIRQSASNNSHIVASIGPDTRVQLGEVRGDWVRLRTHGLSGWVERSAFPVTRDVVSRR
ncbi:MAG: SH3 domain-containing protein [Gemmatimonadaceae bacterium]